MSFPFVPPSPWRRRGNSLLAPADYGAALRVKAHGTISTGTVTLTPGVHSITVGGDQIWAYSGWPESGVEGKITVYVTNGGSATITGINTPNYSGGGSVALTAAGVDTLVFTSIDGGTTIHGFVTGLDLKA